MTSGQRIPIAFIMVIAALTPGCRHQAEPGTDGVERRIELAMLEDKIRGGWAGQMIGVT